MTPSKTENEVLRTFLLMLRSLAAIQQELGIPGWEDLRRQADEMERWVTDRSGK